jgi:peptidoglycan/LPS O-acetylase OafA/YrhL
MNAAENSRIGELDALRGLAALLIVISHICLGRYDNAFIDVAPSALYLFFMISGVVITQSMEQSQSRMEFLRRRFRRIMPTYVLAVLFTAALLVAHHLIVGWETTDVVWRALGNLTLFEHYFRIRYMDGTYWTLTVEVVFYLYIAFCWRKAWTTGAVVMACLGLLLVCFPNSYVHFLISFYLPVVAYFPLFFAGYLFRKIYRGERSIAIHLWLLASLAWQCVLLPQSSLHKFMSLPRHMAMLGICYALFYLIATKKLAKLSNGVSRYLGELSYPIYLIHHFVVFFICMPLFQDKLKWSFGAAAATSMAVTVLLAMGLRKLAANWQHRF